jgi:hypothetical protein
MASILKRYREAVEHKHGWEADLTCGGCGQRGRPEYHGWTPGHARGFGDRPTVYAKLTCASCGCGLEQEAGDEVVQLFRDVEVPAANRRVIWEFVALMVGVPLLLAALVELGARLGWWGRIGFTALALLPILLGPAILYFNYRVASLRRECPCGTPDYVFMGMLGRTYAYRCASCGRLLRLRD